MRFVLDDLLDAGDLFARLGFTEATPDVVDAVLEESARFAQAVLAPLNSVGDRAGCGYDPGTGAVTTPPGFADAYRRYVEAGWPGLVAPATHGGQGMPRLLGIPVKEMIDAANLAWGNFPLLSHGATDALLEFGDDWQQQVFLRPLVDGRWTGTMCLTEAHCGTDLGLLRTRAEPRDDGSFAITGSKIFITAGEHDLAENIVHLVLARLPDAPAGSRGISMFVMMNSARLAVGLQGLGLADRAYQNALGYARERLQMRSLAGPKFPELPADPIIVHPDVRRMLLTCKALVEGGRALAYHAASLVDVVACTEDADERARAEALLGFLTPVTKACLTEWGVECTHHALQCFGGHGYIAEHGMEQLARDARITTIYEGTTGIQALDLLGRKVLQQGGEGLREFLAMVEAFCTAHPGSEFVAPLQGHVATLERLTGSVADRAAGDPEEVGAAAFDYLMVAGYVALGYWWARSAVAADASTRPDGFRGGKREAARFCFARILPRIQAHAAAIEAGAGSLMALDSGDFDRGR